MLILLKEGSSYENQLLELRFFLYSWKQKPKVNRPLIVENVTPAP